ncbi:MAG: glycosyltransferase family 2 protein [Flavobacteriaceae bacterium]
MLKTREISVIIPVFNAEVYVAKAIDSALMQDEVKEIIIVDDGSTDNSLKICLKKSEANDSVKVFFHKDNLNLGRSVSRNLGIKKATSLYIAFLDADDYYLPNRFFNDLQLFNNDNSIDGVYNAIGPHFYREASNVEKEKLKLTTTSVKIKPEELFDNMGPIGHLGYFSGIGLTIKRKSLLNVDLFNESLEVAEDTELWLKMSLLLRLVPGIIDTPVAMRGVHDTNVSFINENIYKKNNLKMYCDLLKWMYKHNLLFKRRNKIWEKIWIQHQINKTGFFRRMLFWITYIIKYPSLLKSLNTYKFFPLIRIFKRTKALNL